MATSWKVPLYPAQEAYQIWPLFFNITNSY